jgi:hypothetical protein
MIRRDHGSRLIGLVAVLAGLFAGATPARADVNLLVPSYFIPNSGGPGGVGDGWAAMAAAAGQVPLTAILNPDSGPFTGNEDNYPQRLQAYVDAVTNLEKAGGKVIAYIATGFGSESLATIQDKISAYLQQFPGLIQGFFLDEMSVNLGTLPHYQQIYNMINPNGSHPYTVIANPGEPFLADGITPSDYLTTADVLNIFEGPHTSPGNFDIRFDRYPDQTPYKLDWFLGLSSDRLSNIVYDAPSDVGLADVAKAVHFNAGYVYVTNDTLPNPFDQLPSYWDQEVAKIHELNAVPEPSSFAIVAVCGLLTAARYAFGRGRTPGSR